MGIVGADTSRAMPRRLIKNRCMIDSGRADCEPDVESGGRDLEQRAEEHPGSVPGPGAGRQERVLSSSRTK